MTLVRIDILLIIASFCLSIFTALKVWKRSWQEKKVEATVVDLKKKLRRSIVHITVDNASDDIINKTLESSSTWGVKKKLNEEKEGGFIEAKKLLRKADVHIGRGEYQLAEKYLIEALSLDENNKEINKKLALTYLQQQKYPKAELVYLRLIEHGSRDPAVYGNLGLVLYHEGRLEMAIKAYQKAVELDPKRSARYANIGQIYYEMQDLHNAITYFEKAYIRGTKNIDYMFILAKLYEEKGLKEKAKYFYHKILDIEPYNEEAKEGIKKLL